MAKAKETAAPVKAGDKLTFKGYEGLEEGMEPIFQEGDTLTVVSVGKTSKGQTEVEAQSESGDADTIFVPGEATLGAAEKAPAKPKKASAPAKAEMVEDDAAEETAPAKRGKAVKAPAEKPAKEKAVKAAKPAKEKAGKALVPARTAEEAMQELVHMPTVRKYIKKGALLETAKDLVVQAEQSFFHLGGVLAEIQTKKLYMEAGYTAEKKVKENGKPRVMSAFEQYINAELGIEYRKGMYLIDIYTQFAQIEGIDEARLAAIGWTKLKLLSRKLRNGDAEDVDGLLEDAETMTRDELEAHIKETSVGGKGKGDKVKKVAYKFTAFADEAEYINGAISRAQEMVEGGQVNDALRHIVREWAMMQDGVEIPLKDAVAALESRYGVKLIAEVDAAEAEAEAPKAKAKAVKKAAKAPAKTAAVAKPVKAAAKAAEKPRKKAA